MMWRIYYAVLRLISPLARWVFRVLNTLTRQQRAKVILLDEEGSILLVQNALGDRRWTLPGGGIEKGESVREAAAREVCEELGIELDIKKCTEIGSLRVVKGGYDAPIVVCRLEAVQKSRINPRKLEIYAAEWYDRSKLPHETQSLVDEALALLSADTSI